jgi:hypothetical protein
MVGCALKYGVSYSPSSGQPKIYNSNIGKVYIDNFQDSRAKPDEITITGFVGSFNNYSTEVPPKDIFSQGFKQELVQQGIILANNIDESSAYIKGTLRTFEFSVTVGGFYSTRAVLDIELYSNKTKKLLWKGTTESSAESQPNSLMESMTEVAKRSFNGVVQKVIRRTVHNPDFQDSILKLGTK